MRYLLSIAALLSLAAVSVVGQETKAPVKASVKAPAKAPAKLTFDAKTGKVAYDHAAHLKREKDDCKVCHDVLFQQSAKAPLNFKIGMHKPAEAAKKSCGACHHAGGTAFETKGNCNKCHAKPGATAAGVKS